MKNIRQAALSLTVVLFMTGCAAILQSPGAGRTGTVTFTVGVEPGRTLAPSLSQFAKIVLSFEGSPAVADAPVANGKAAVDLPVGSWKVRAKAYRDAQDTAPAALSAENVIEFDGESVSGDTAFILAPAEDGPGTLEYLVALPEGVALGGGSAITIKQDGAVPESLAGDGFTDGVYAISEAGATISAKLDEGWYTVDILLESEAGDTAAYRQNTLILPGLVTKIGFAPGAEDFLSSEERAALTTLSGVVSFGTKEAGIDLGALENSGENYSLRIDYPKGAEALSFALGKPEAYAVTSNSESVTLTDAGEGFASATIEVDTASAAGEDIVFVLAVKEEGKAAVDIAVRVRERISWTAEADGEEDDSDSTVINFVFSRAVADLEAAHFSIENDTGAAATGALTGEGKNWSLGITVEKAGNLRVSINKDGVEGGPQDVAVYKEPAIEFKDTANKSSGNGSSIFDLEEWDGAGTAEESWTLNVAEKAGVYFAVTKAAGQSIAAAGTDGSKVSIASSGEAVDGSAPDATLAVVTVDTGETDSEDLYFENRTFNFTLTVSRGGDTIKTIAVTLNRAVDESVPVTVYRRVNGALVDQEAAIGPQENPETDIAPVETLYDANRWLEAHAESGTEEAHAWYVIRLAADQTTKPVYIRLADRKYVGVELRGAAKERIISRDALASYEYLNGSYGIFNTNSTWARGLITLSGFKNGDTGEGRYLTLKLGKNITIDGKKEENTNNLPGVESLVQVNGYYVTLVLEPGSKVTGYNYTGTTKNARYCPVYFGPNGSYFSLIINGGAICGNNHCPSQYRGLIYADTSGTFTFSHADGLKEADVFYDNTANNNIVKYGYKVNW